MTTGDVNGVVVPTYITLPTHNTDPLGKAGTIFISGGKLHFNPTDGGAAEVVTSS